MDSISTAQQDMRSAYYEGIPGVIASGTAWMIAGIVALLVNPMSGILTLIFGGTLIFPASVVLCKLLGRTGKHQKDNPLAPLAIEGTVWMLLSIPVAVAASLYKVELFFPAMLMVIAGRYLTFRTLYGARIFWIFSFVLILAAVSLALLEAPTYLGGIVGGGVELLFAGIIYLITKKTAAPAAI